ncbi:MAG: hypothetical protein OQJ81_10155, partial [Melioribacteraceae bacterium]|nr:hypothetical protein [Melioribacteraceae bacterium]
YAELFFDKYDALSEAPIVLNNDLISIGIAEGNASSIDAEFGYQVRLNRNLDPINCVIGDGSVLIRDKLVKEGKLNPPFTDSKEFLDSIMRNIEYWDGQKFVKYQ